MLAHNLTFSPVELAALCQRYHIERLALFGSALRGDFTADSDVDVLVAFRDGRTPDFFALYDLERALSELFGGRPVDIVTYKALNPHLREDVLGAAVTLYEQA